MKDAKSCLNSNVRLAVFTVGALIALPVFSIAADAPDVNKPVTFAKDIAPIFQEKCQECHRARIRGVAPCLW